MRRALVGVAIVIVATGALAASARTIAPPEASTPRGIADSAEASPAPAPRAPATVGWSSEGLGEAGAVRPCDRSPVPTSGDGPPRGLGGEPGDGRDEARVRAPLRGESPQIDHRTALQRVALEAAPPQDALAGEIQAGPLAHLRRNGSADADGART